MLWKCYYYNSLIQTLRKFATPVRENMRSKGLMALVCTFNIWQNIARKLQHVLLNMKAATLLVIKCCGKCFESTIRNFQKLYRNSLILVNLNHFKNQQKMFLTPPPPLWNKQKNFLFWNNYELLFNKFIPKFLLFHMGRGMFTDINWFILFFSFF